MLRAALIGAGAIAREHLLALSAMPRVEIAGVCDLSAARAEAAAERFGVRRWYTDLRRMLDEAAPDLVHVTTPPASHYSIAQCCLAAGVNVLCEKPITAEYEQFENLRALAAGKGLLLVENQNLRFHSSTRRLQELVSSGELGEVTDVQVQFLLNIYARGSRLTDANFPHACRDMPGGIIADFLPHMGYLAYVFAGPPVAIATAWSKRTPDSPLPADEFRALIKCEHAMASLTFSGNAQPDGLWLRVAGTRMHAEANLFQPPRLTLRRSRAGAAPLASMVDGIVESRDMLSGAVGGLWRKLAGTSNYDGLAEFVARTYAALESKSAPPVSLDEIGAIARLVTDLASKAVML